MIITEALHLIRGKLMDTVLVIFAFVIIITLIAMIIYAIKEKIQSYVIKRERKKHREVNEQIERLQQEKKHVEQKKNYSKKKLLTATEIEYYKAIKNNTPHGYVVLPQINLATIINRTDEHKYQNELYRNIDFVIFDLYLNPVVLIEINDYSHKDKSRWMRDQKVKHICEEANLPIITLWVDFGIHQDYIKKRIEEYCVTSA